MGDFKAIPTRYKGVQFRSRLEAQWAEFFDVIKVRWLYEPSGFTNGDVSYLPDFWLPEVKARFGPEVGCFFEVKPPIESTWSEEFQSATRKARVLVCGTGRPMVMATESPSESQPEYLIEFFPERLPDGSVGCSDDYGLSLGLCGSCGWVHVAYQGGDAVECACGGEVYDTEALNRARARFPNFCRWIKAA